MSKKFTMLLAALFLVMGATDAQVTKYYKPGERKTTLAAGDKVMFYNTAFNGDEDRTGFLVDNGSSFGHSKQKPTASPIFSEKVGVWTIETAEDNSTYYKVQVKGTNGYVGIGGATNNGSAKDLYFHHWADVDASKRAGVNSENAAGSVVVNAAISASDNVWLVANGAPDAISNTWNGNANSFANWSTGHPYAVYSVVEATTAELEALLVAAKGSAETSLADLAKLSISSAVATIESINAVTLSNNDLETALNSIDALVAEAKASINGKNVVFDNTADGARNGLSIKANTSDSKAYGSTSEGDETIWTIKQQADGSFKLYNFVADKYLGEPGDMALKDEDGAAAYNFIVTDVNKVALVKGNKMLHQANYWGPTNYDLISWYDLNDGASLWTLTEKEIKVSREQYDLATAAKASLPYAIQQAYGLVKDASKYSSNAPETDKNEGSSYANLLDNTYSTYFHSAWSYGVDGNHYLQAEVSEEVKDFCFYFKKRHNTNNNRPIEIEILGSTDGTEFTPIATINSGLPTNETDVDYFSPEINATENVNYLRFVVKNTNTGSAEAKGNPFFHFSEFYIFPAVSDVFSLFESYYSFGATSITDEGIAEAANGLINAEKTLALSNIKKEIQTILNTNKDNHEEVPALGKYSTAGYNALEAAYEDLNATQESLENAIAAFEASLNRPVYFITSAWDGGYPAGSAIYYDGMNWLWKKANKFDRQMWMTIPGYTNGDVPSVAAYDKDGAHYGFYDYITGTKMRNQDVQIVAVPSWTDAYNLQYDGQAMHAQSDKKLVGWYPATISSNQASAWKVEYLGGSYSLGKLSPEKLEALANLQAAFDSKSYLFNATYGDGLGQYQDNGNAESIYNTLMEVAQFLSSKLSLFADEGCTIDNINALTDALDAIEVSINMPEDGKYYRIYGANNVIPSGYYITCHTNNDGGRIALTAEANASTIYYYKDGKLQAYLSGKYIATSSSHYVFDNKDHAASGITFEASNRVAGAFTIKSADVFLHYKVYFDAVELDRCRVDEAVGHDWYLQEVTMEEINKDIVTDLNQVSDQARYKIYGERGFMYVDAANGIVKSTYSESNRVDYSPVNEYHNFAIVNIDDKSYLYSVGAKKFVVKSGNTVALVDFPEQEITIEAAADQNTDYDWLIKMGGTNLLNITNQHNSGIYTAYNTEDPGNRWALRKVGKFDPEYATTIRKVSVSYTVDGKTTTKAHAIKEGNTFSFTIPNASFSVVKSCKLGTEEMKDAEGGKFSFVVERDTALSVEIETNLPIKVAENENNIPADAWYYFVMHSNPNLSKYIQYLPDTTYIEWTDAAVRRDSIDTYSWALVGNVLDGFKLVNKAAKDMALLSKGSGNPSMDAYANGTAFLLDSTSTKIEGAFCLKYPNGNYLNAQGGKVAHWNDADAGSTIIPALSPSESLAELAALLLYAGTVATINNDKAEALTTAISAAQEVYNTSTENAAVEAQVTALNTAIDNVIKAEVGAGLFRLKNSASGLYMTIVTPEAADGIQIKAKDSDATKQAFYIESTAEVVGVYNIKSTEGYFMASSAYWNYGAYKTANEAGRAHKVEYLGEGKYALKTLLGYAGPNKNTTDENSPLYSNHTADNNGREWELEALVKSNITYIYKDGETEIARQTVSQYVGLPYPTANVTLPLGYTATALEGNVAEGETEKVVACVLNAEAIPFSYYASYEDVEQWYYLNFTAAHNYLYYADDNTVLDATKTEINRADREAYAWAFIGTPATGFQVVNKAAGNAKGLKALESGAAVGEGAHTFKLTASVSIADVKGFYMAAINGESADRFNKQGNPAKVVYWDGADAGSTFTVTVCPFGAVAELEELIVIAEALKATVDANTGDKIGEYAAATGETLATAIETAKTKGDAATADDVAALQAVIDATKVILPTAGSYYQFHSAVAFAETKAVYSDESSALWMTLNSNDKSFYWMAVENAGGIALKNAKSGKYLNGNAGQSGAWSVSDTPANIDVTILTKEGANGYQYGVVLNDWQMHAAGHNGGKGTSGSIVSWNAEAGSASAWYMVEVELPEFYTVVYNFKYEGATKYTQTATLSAGAEFPEFTVTLPYGVSVADERPTGTVTGNHTIDFNLKIEKALPFVAATDVNSIKTWYYVQMHANAAVTAYLEDNGGENIAWNNKSVDDSEIDSHLWGFVGDVWNGIKMVNKNTGNAIVSTRGNAVLGTAANATAFIPTISNGVLSDWFCLKYPESNYLNAQGNQAEGAGIVASYGNADNGSSLFVTEYNKEYVVSVSSVGYSTYYSDYRLVIPATVEAYVVTSVENREVVLEQVTGVLPAHTGVILRGKGDHSFVTSAAATAEIETNLLKGTTTKQLITPAEGYTCYVLANPAGGNGVGLYIASLNKDENGNEGNTHFYNNANKVYLLVENPVVEEESGQSARALRFRFGGEGTTEIEPSTLNSQPSTIIYDLTGRRINEIVEKGIYIVNGKKVVIR